MKKFVALLILAALVLGSIPVFAATEKDGYALTPTSAGADGVNVASTFQLTTPEDFTPEDIGARLTLDGQAAPTVEKTGDRTFLITPAAQLSANTLYTFRLTRPEAAELTWVFQTAKKFAVTSVFPANQATNVPINSGIEITFSTEGYGEIDSYFSISPAVKGTFEYHKNTAVFVPEALAYKTMYTVTLQGGIALASTGEAITEDTVFSFETQAKKEKEAVEAQESIWFSPTYTEYGTTDPPSLYLYAYDSANKQYLSPKINVYQFKSDAQGLEAALKRQGAPYWSNYAREESYTSVSSLSRVLSFQAEMDGKNHMLTLPETLSAGFYVIEAVSNDAYDQMIIQVSDLPVQVIADNDKAIVWVNDIQTGTAATGATVYDVNGKATYKTDEYGIAVINRALCTTDGVEQLLVTAKDGRTCTWFRSSISISSGENSDDYWKYLQLDRSLFQRDDDVLFWGFVQNRNEEESVQSVRAVLTQGYYFYSGSDRDILQSQTVPVTEGTYSGALSLPNLDAGTYCLTIYHGDILLTSTYFSVEEYEKPTYKLEITTEKKAVFADETVPFHISTAFFEGTPVPGLELSYRFSGYQSRSGTVTTDAAGKAVVTEALAPNDSNRTTLSFSAGATLPEIGDISDSASVRVFTNDIDLGIQVKRTGGNATLTVDVNTITLDRLNDGTATGYYDYLDAPVAGRAVTAEVFRTYYTKTESGTYYDYIEKKSKQCYTYERQQEALEQYTLTTDEGGHAQLQFTVPDVKGESYYVTLTCLDNNGRKVSHTVYIGRDYASYYNSIETDRYMLQTEKTRYDVGEAVELTLQRGEDTVPGGNVLFVQERNGITAYQAGENPYTFSFSEQHIPNIYIYAYCFDGMQYQCTYYMYEILTYQPDSRALALTITPDQDSYAPGDTCTVRVTATDVNGAPKQASINLSVVDEALFALKNYTVDPLQALYTAVRVRGTFSYATHAYTISVRESAGGGSATTITGDADIPLGIASESNLRETFLDTAFFDTIQTDAQGQAVYTFGLPDNITSWRLTAAGISKDLYAGSATGNIAVTQPLFLSYTLSDTFLTGDTPTVGITAYGSGLTGSEPVTFTVWDEADPDRKYTADGTALSRTDVPLWKMTDVGEHALILQASVNGGQSDMVKHTYEVLSSYRQVTTAQYYDLTRDTVLQTGTSGLTNITFTDRSRGQYLSELFRMRWGSGDRVERMLVRRESAALIAAYFPDLSTWTRQEDAFDPLQYQRGDGGMAILPYAESDVVTTVKLMPYVLDEVNKSALKNYLYDIYEGDSGQPKTCALYGLAQLKEPVLLELDAYAQLEDLSIQDAVYVALGYCALGETASANALYSAHVAPSLEQIAPYYRVNTGADNDDILEATSAAVLLAATLDQPEWEGLYQYCVKNQTVDILITLEKFRYIEMQMEKTTAEGGSVTYSLYGETYTRDLSGGRSYTLRIPAQNMSAFALQSVEGAVGAVSSYEIPMTDGTTAETGISVTRKYYNANGGALENNSMKQGDLVRVELTVNYAPKTVQGSYSVTDYLPAGLAYVSNSAKIENAARFGYGYSCYATTEGQKVLFYDYNRADSNQSVYYYYARVICPGTFRAEGTVVQNLAATGYMTLGADDTITIS
ncbi:MAG: Ig-like domain-containing protein [Oscillospiraceae bacterium]|nr:Ig-like domain-containing protein [Oscillospiraceae bacterium]